MKRIILYIAIIIFLIRMENIGISKPPGNPDVNLDGIVDITDLALTLNDVCYFVIGSPYTDIDGNGFTDMGDVALVINAIP